MIIVRAYQILGEATVTAQAVVKHDYLGNPMEPHTCHLRSLHYDATSAIGSPEIGRMFSGWAQNIDLAVLEEFGGWHNLL